MFRSGRFTPGFSFLIAGSSHFLILSRKTFASTGPVIFRCGGNPGRLYATDVDESAHGIWTQPLHAANWSLVSGASLVPKSTVRFVIAWMPPPEPIGLYCTRVPVAESYGCTHADTSGETNVLPAPLSVVPFVLPVAVAARVAAIANAARVTMRFT